MSKSFCLLFLLSLTFSCSPPSDQKTDVSNWHTVESKDFSLRLPGFMKEASNLNDDAILQYQNLIKEFYCIVIQESIVEYDSIISQSGLSEDYPLDLDGYARLIGDRFEENSDEIISKSELKSISVNGKNAKYFEVKAKINGLSVYYHYGFIKGDTAYYQVVSWTLPDKEKKFKETMLNILKSFKEKK